MHTPLFRSASFLACCTLLLPAAAQAGGMEYAGTGSDSIGRGGASVARATDPTILRSNPAGLAELPKVQFLLDGQLALHDSCYKPSGYYGWGVYRGGSSFHLPNPSHGQNEPTELGTPGAPYYTDPLDEVCLEQGANPFKAPGLLVPQLGLSFPVTETLGMGFGLIFPSQMPTGKWGSSHGVIHNAENELRPSPARYQLLESRTIGLFPSVGLGWAITPWLRVGGTFNYGWVKVDQKVMAVLTGGTGPAGDVISHVKATDNFVPGATGSVHLVPWHPIDVVGSFRWQGAVDASGTAFATTGAFEPGSNPYVTELAIDHVKQNMPWAATLALRYAERYRPRTAKNDPMTDEKWDVEFDLVYELNDQLESQTVDPADGQLVAFQAKESGALTYAEFPNHITIPKNWQNQWSARLGGSVSVIPNAMSVSLGAHYETRGVDPAFAQVDFMPFARVGGHAGITIRLTEYLPSFFTRNPMDLRISYGFIQQEEIRVAPPAHSPREEGGFDKTAGAPPSRFEPAPVVEENPPVSDPHGTAALPQIVDKTPPDDPAYIINSGTYSSRLHIISVGALYHF